MRWSGSKSMSSLIFMLMTFWQNMEPVLPYLCWFFPFCSQSLSVHIHTLCPALWEAQFCKLWFPDFLANGILVREGKQEALEQDWRGDKGRKQDASPSLCFRRHLRQWLHVSMAPSRNALSPVVRHKPGSPTTLSASMAQPPPGPHLLPLSFLATKW